MKQIHQGISALYLIIRYKNPIAITIENEKGHKPGKFGWCIMSRETAVSFCKDTRVPVCSKELKYAHLQEMIMA